MTGDKIQWLFDHGYMQWVDNYPTMTAKAQSLVTGIPVEELERWDREG